MQFRFKRLVKSETIIKITVGWQEKLGILLNLVLAEILIKQS